MIDVAGIELLAEEQEKLAHPLVGGIILFTRNYESIEQLQQLIQRMRKIKPLLLIAVDHEGGRVQRFRQEFSALPPASWIGKDYNQHPRQARLLAEAMGWLMASELRSVDIDFSFAPVLDLDFGMSQVIGHRAFHASPDAVSELACAYVKGMHEAGMAAVGKHFPGHGGVAADSHTDLPIDNRDLEDLLLQDFVPFERLIAYGIDGLMPAHVLFPNIAKELAGFSPFWIQQILRKRFQFEGVVFSDDLSMEAATMAGDCLVRTEMALAAGCDMALICNQAEKVEQVLDQLNYQNDVVSKTRLARMHGCSALSPEKLRLEPKWKNAMRLLADYEESGNSHLII